MYLDVARVELVSYLTRVDEIDLAKMRHPSFQGLSDIPLPQIVTPYLKKTSEYDGFPWLNPLVAFIHMISDPFEVHQASTVQAKIDMLGRIIRTQTGCLLACWPTDDCHEAFLIDNPLDAMRQIWHEK